MIAVEHAFASASHPGATINEDEVAFVRDQGWVLDGATSLSGRRQVIGGQLASDAAWFVRAFSDGMRRRPRDRPVAAWAHTVLADLDDQARALWGGWGGADVPSASYAHVEVHRDTAVFWNLGDCRVLYQVDGGPIASFGSSAVGELDAVLLARYRDLRAAGLEHARAWAQLVPTIRAHRTRMNQPDGYWILSPDGRGLAHLERAEVGFRHELRALLVTDGLYRLVDTYDRYAAEALFARAFAPGGLSALVHELRALEAADERGVAYARVKLKDDASALAAIVRRPAGAA